jgi:hypothetical protein
VSNREEIHFTKWLNKNLESSKVKVKSIYDDLRDGTYLIQNLSNKKVEEHRIIDQNQGKKRYPFDHSILQNKS